jgi:hypothetical protein
MWGAGNGSNGGFWEPVATGLPTYTAGDWHVVGIAYKGGVVRDMIVDGHTIHSEAVTGALPQSTLIGLALGSRNDWGEWYGGTIRKVLVCGRYLSAPQRQRISEAIRWEHK